MRKSIKEMGKKLLSGFKGKKIPYEKFEELGWRIESSDGFNYDLIKCPDDGLFYVGRDLSKSGTSMYITKNNEVVILVHHSFPSSKMRIIEKITFNRHPDFGWILKGTTGYKEEEEEGSFSYNKYYEQGAIGSVIVTLPNYLLEVFNVNHKSDVENILWCYYNDEDEVSVCINGDLI